jgi:cyclophilin family peptidyl-prolyl cis-trans isomerase
MKKSNITLLIVALFISLNISAQKNTEILIETSMGEITVMLFNDTEFHKENFIKLVTEKYYDGVLFHRVIKDFMIQAGDPDSKNAPAGKALGMGGPAYTIPAEITPKHFHKKGVLSAARTGDSANPTRRSSGSQFYLVTGKKYTDEELNSMETKLYSKFTPEQREAYKTVGGTPFLDGQYTVFGEVVKGIEIVDQIQSVATGTGDRPVTDVKIIKMTIK